MLYVTVHLRTGKYIIHTEALLNFFNGKIQKRLLIVKEREKGVSKKILSWAPMNIPSDFRTT